MMFDHHYTCERCGSRITSASLQADRCPMYDKGQPCGGTLRKVGSKREAKS